MQSLASGYTYDPLGDKLAIMNRQTLVLARIPLAGQPLQVNYGNGVEGLFGYNDHLQVSSITYREPSCTTNCGDAGPAWVGLLGMTYNYTDINGHNGQIQGITDARGAPYSTSYTYDAWNRLNHAQTSDLTSVNTWSINWNYDRFANRLGQVEVGGTLPVYQPQFEPDPGNHNRLVYSGFTYDAAGNLTDDATSGRIWSYDAENRLVEQIDSGTVTAQYLYDGGALRFEKGTVANGVTTTTDYVFSGTKPIAEYVNGVLNKEYIYAGDQLTATLDASGNLIYHHSDQLSIRVQSDGGGNVIRTYGHLPYGDAWYETGTPDKWKFTTYERDAESEPFDYADFRHYTNLFGRFVSGDKLGGTPEDPQSLNRYSYAANDPINLVDPLGLDYIQIGNCIYYREYSFVDGEYQGYTDFVVQCTDNTGSTGPGSLGLIGGGGAVTGKKNLIKCASDYGTNHSIAALFHVQNTFLGNLFLGNSASGVADLYLFVSGSKTPTAGDVGTILVGGGSQGIPGALPKGSPFTGPADRIGDAALTAAAAGGIQAINSAQSAAVPIELGITAAGKVATPAVQIGSEAAESVAAGIGLAKFGFDAFVFAIGVFKCH